MTITELTISLNEVLTLIAIILGPIIAVQLQKYLDRKREIENGKINIFKMLMATRGSVLSVHHVDALNRIDLEFSRDKKYKKVINAWKEYFDNLNLQCETEDQYSRWGDKNEELLATLLFEMGQSLGYSFDKVSIKRHRYSPIGHERFQRENEIIRQGLISILNQEKSIPIVAFNDESTSERQAKLQEEMLRYYELQNKNIEGNIDLEK